MSSVTIMQNGRMITLPRAAPIRTAYVPPVSPVAVAAPVAEGKSKPTASGLTQFQEVQQKLSAKGKSKEGGGLSPTDIYDEIEKITRQLGPSKGQRKTK